MQLAISNGFVFDTLHISVVCTLYIASHLFYWERPVFIQYIFINKRLQYIYIYIEISLSIELRRLGVNKLSIRSTLLRIFRYDKLLSKL